jgi:hypothetical protein
VEPKIDQNMSLSSTFMPVDPDFYEVIDELKSKDIAIKLFFFTDNTELDSISGVIDSVIRKDKSEFLTLHNGGQVRLDRIITIHGKPGPLYDYYESFGNACLDCKVDF